MFVVHVRGLRLALLGAAIAAVLAEELGTDVAKLRILSIRRR